MSTLATISFTTKPGITDSIFISFSFVFTYWHPFEISLNSVPRLELVNFKVTWYGAEQPYFWDLFRQFLKLVPNETKTTK